MLSGFIRRRASQSLLLAVAVVASPMFAEAATINIILSDMDVSYTGNTSGGVLFDTTGGTPGGGLNPALADSLSSGVFELDGTTVATLPAGTEDLFGDLRVINMGPTIAKNVFHPTLGNNGGGFGFDFFTDNGFKLQLGMTSVSLFLSDGVFFFTGQATVLPGQNLPGGLAFDESQPVQFSYTATLPAVQAGATTNSAMSSGAFTISGIAIPEPAAYALVCTGMLAALFAVRRQQRRSIT
jgi:hypothetical protein